jgi:hypothetical protein
MQRPPRYPIPDIVMATLTLMCVACLLVYLFIG